MVVDVPGVAAVVLDSPHSGVFYPDDFRHCCDFAMLRSAQDTHVEKLYDFAPAMGVAWIEALFPRSYLDANRNLTEIDVTLFDEAWPDAVETDAAALAKVNLGKGLIWRCTDDGAPLYDRKLTVAEVRKRIDSCWKPYHLAVASAIEAAHARHGYSIHVNCHSMPAVASQFATVRRYGGPARDRHGVQVEVNRRLYMDEKTLEPTAGLNRLRSDLKAMVAMLVETDPRSLG